MDTSFAFQWDTEILKYCEMIENFRFHQKGHKTPGFFDVFVVDSLLKNVPSMFATFLGVYFKLLFSNQISDPRYDFCSATSGASTGACSEVVFPEKNVNNYRGYDEKRWGKKSLLF